jgi:hypothetical protein
MTRLVPIAALGLLALALSACGGSSDNCGPLSAASCGSGSGGGGGGGPTAAVVTVSSSVASVPTDGSSTATITALVKDANNSALANVAVTLSASAGTLSGATTTTSSSGTVSATLSGQGVAAGTIITVTATAGAISGKATVSVASTQRTMSLLTSAAQIPSDASKSATISAVVRDANNNLVPGVAVSFQASSGAIAPVPTTAGAGATPPVSAGTTDANGEAQASLTTPGDPSDRTITVTATLGTANAQVTVSVTGTTLSLTAPSSLVLNNTAGGSISLANSAGQGIANTTVMLASANGNTLSATTLTTDANGHASFTVTGVKGGNDTLTATALGLTQTAPMVVSTQNFTVTSPANGTKVNLGAMQTVTVTWLNNGSPVAGQPVTFSATRGTLSPTTPVMTAANGTASVQISSNGAGPSIVSASGTGVSAQVSLDFVALAPSQISVQAQPASVAVQGQSTISALVRDANNNLVEGATVNFVLVTDPTNGSLSSATATTDAQGRAQTVYTAGNSTSGANGVAISATVAATSITGSATLTVGGQTAFLSLGTGNTIITSAGTAIYEVLYTVFAVDAQGAALPNVPITVSVLPVAYGKGVMAGCPMPGPNWGPSYSTATSDPDSWNGTKLCKNEDTDYTGNIDSLGFCPSGSTTPCKDYNGNGRLDPGNVAVVSPASGVTDSSGRLDVTISYPRDHSYWVEVSLVATTTVQGTQSTASSTFLLQGAVSDYSCGTGPPGPVSPYGIAGTCANPN